MEANEFTGWLLDSSIPSIRYFTLRDLLHRPEDAPEVQEARRAIMQTGPVPALLAQQTAEGHWEGEQSYYTPKYVSTHWSMLLLAELAADPNDERAQRVVDFMLADTVQRAINTHAPHRQDVVCFWANLLRYAVYGGRADDPRLGNIVEILALAAQARGWACQYNHELACVWGAIRTLWGLAALPDRLRTLRVNEAIHSGSEFVFGAAFSLLEGNYPTRATSIHKHWSRLNFPLFYQADVLLALRAASELGLMGLPQVQAALKWLAERRQSNGRWQGTSPYRSRTWKELGDQAETERWVSLQAATLLQQAGIPLS